MNELELLYLVLVVVYAWECACWVPRGWVVFRTWLNRRWRPARPGELLGNQRGGFVFAAPLPPLGAIVCASRQQLPVAPDGSLQSFERAIRESLDTKAIDRRWADFQGKAADLRWVTNSLFGYLFFLAPALIWRLGLRVSWGPLLAGLLALTATASFMFRRAHKALYPNAEDERFTHVLTILLSPVTAIRAQDALSRGLFKSFHPLAVAQKFCTDEHFRTLAREILRDLRYPPAPSPRRPTGQPDGRDVNPGKHIAQKKDREMVERNARGTLQNAVENFLKKNGVQPDALLQPPAPADPTCRSYCPRCLSQFTRSDGDCDDCGGVALRPFNAS